MKKKLAIEVLLEGKCVKIGSRIFKLKINTIALWKKENNCYWDVNICINTFLTTNFEIVPDPQQEYYRKEINKILNNGKFVNVKFEGGGQLQGSQETYTTLSNETIMEKIKKSKPIVSYTEVKEEPDYKKGDAVILNNPDGKLQIITFMNDTNEYVYTKDGGFKASYIKRKATLKDLQAEIKRMFEKYDEYKSGNGIYHLSDDGFLMYKDLIEKFQVPLLYDVLLNFIINAKPITDEQPEQVVTKNKAYPFCCIEKCEKFDGTVKNNCKKYSNIFNCKYHTKTDFEIEPEQEFEEFYDHDNESHRVKKLIRNQKLIINRFKK